MSRSLHTRLKRLEAKAASASNPTLPPVPVVFTIREAGDVIGFTDRKLTVLRQPLDEPLEDTQARLLGLMDGPPIVFAVHAASEREGGPPRGLGPPPGYPTTPEAS